jgi:uncharacterized protein
MKQLRSPHNSIALLALALIIVIAPSFGGEKTIPTRCVIAKVPYVQQMRNYCGPASLTSVLTYWGVDVDQATVGNSVFDKSLQATNGADMILFARQKGLSAYSWNSDLADLKSKLVSGCPVIVLQDSSITDKSGHYRVATGYDDEKRVIYVNDPYEPANKAMPYDKFQTLWDRHGNWALLACAPDHDQFKKDLDENNPVVHIDLAYIYYKHHDNESAERESMLALKLEPGNYCAKDLLHKATLALGARGKSEKTNSRLTKN